MKVRMNAGLVGSIVLMAAVVFGQDAGSKKDTTQNTEGVAFTKEVFPILQKRCLPCHAQDEYNPSELSLDSYDLMARGGKHGAPWVAGKSAESLLIQKLSETPPFGDRMPFHSKRKIKEGKAVWLTDDEVKTLAKWIDQGAKEK